MTYCDVCGNGKFSLEGNNETVCETCPSGSFALEKYSACYECPPGTFTTVRALVRCAFCIFGHRFLYKDMGACMCVCMCCDRFFDDDMNFWYLVCLYVLSWML